MKVLVVDDSVAMRRIIINALSSMSGEKLQFDEAGDGKEAVDKIKLFTYDMIMMDWNMPNMSGLAAVQKIRSFKVRTPIIMVTTNTDKSNVITALKAGANNYIAKPFTNDILVQKFRDTITFSQQNPA